MDKLIEYFNSLPEVKRLKELEEYISKNKEIENKFNEIKELQKKMVNANEFNQFNQLKVYKNEYENKKKELSDIPFLDEYIELLEIINEKLTYLSNEIEYRLDKEING